MKGHLFVLLKAVPNHDFPMSDFPNSDLPPMRNLCVGSISEASEKCRAYIERYSLGGGHWAGGEVVDTDGTVVANISYNGRAWTPEADWRMQKEIVLA